MTVARNVAFPLEMRRVPAADIAARVDKVLALVGLAQYGPRFPHQLSGGQQQRVALARAMVFEPPLLLMDEPLGALDKKLREQMQLEIKHLHQRLGMSIIYVTHDQEEALTMSDRIAVFNNGRIEQIGTPADLYDRPTTRFVAGFIGETNLFEGAVAAIDGAYCRIEANGVTLRARYGDRPSLRQSMSVAVRPERTRLSSAGRADADGDNRLVGEVVELIYLGRFRKYVVRAAGADVCVVQQILGGDEPVFEPGQTVCLDWRADDAVAVADTAAAGGPASGQI
jgi:putative spermidine/putrescine transport system ATP-binding protein